MPYSCFQNSDGLRLSRVRIRQGSYLPNSLLCSVDALGVGQRRRREGAGGQGGAEPDRPAERHARDYHQLEAAGSFRAAARSETQPRDNR